MPELPDVQVFKENVDATSLDRRIDHVHLNPAGLLDGVSDSTLRRRLEGRPLEATRRHGKHLFVRVGDDGRLRLHLGMTGRPAYWEHEDGEGRCPDCGGELERIEVSGRGTYLCPRKQVA